MKRLMPILLLALVTPSARAAAPPVRSTDRIIREVAGTAEFLRSLPKEFATLVRVDPKGRTVTLRFEGKKEERVWPLTADAEIKIDGWWGRLDQLGAGGRVWVWLTTDRKKQPKAVAMIADDISQQDIRGDGKASKKEVEDRRARQRAALRKRWLSEGLPGTLSFVHLFSGEAEVMLDHEAMRWGRSLRRGDRITLATDPPISCVVKEVRPWRERTQVRLVAKAIDLSDLKLGERVGLRMPAPSAAVEASKYPPDIDLPRPREERVSWFLASVYCTCGVRGDTCTGHFYTLASCNPNGCGQPNAVRKRLGQLIDKGLTDRQVFDKLLDEEGPGLLQPHLLP